MLKVAIRHQLRDFTLAVNLHAHQELLALFGPSGAGKSITLKIIAGLLRPDAGQITLNERTLFDSHQALDLPPQQRHVGYLMQDYTLFPHLTVKQNIAYGLRGQSAAAQSHRVETLLRLIQLPGYAAYRPHELSGGQQQRVALARALAINPQILLLDEPFSALDGPTRAQLRLELRQLQTQLNIPTILVTHDLAETNLLADRMAVYHRGRILQIGPPSQIMHRPCNLTVARLIGTENIWPGRVIANRGPNLLVDLGPFAVSTPLYPVTKGQAVYCCLRPEQIILLRSKKAQQQRDNVVRGQINTITTDGLSFKLRLQLVGTRLHPQQPHDLTVTLPLHVYEALGPQVGQNWQLSLKQTAIHLIAADDE